jgi:hypothetical protein
MVSSEGRKEGGVHVATYTPDTDDMGVCLTDVSVSVNLVELR